MTETFSELGLLAGTIYGEARNQEYAGKVGVGLVVRTRVRYPGWWGRNWREVILSPHQFSCWSDHNRDAIMQAMAENSSDWQSCMNIARQVYLGEIEDKIGAPTHYCRFDVHPAWRIKLKFLCQIEDHVFYHDPAIDRS